MPHRPEITGRVPVTARFAFTIDEAAASIGVCRVTLYKLLNAGKLQSIEIEGRRLITPDAIKALIAATAAAAPPNAKAPPA